MASKKKNQKQFVVGYEGQHLCVYGPNDEFGHAAFVDRLTEKQAYAKAAWLHDTEYVRVIYKLVPHRIFRKGEKVKRNKRKANP